MSRHRRPLRASTDRVPVPAGDIPGVRRFALSGWLCLRCAATSKAGNRLACCDDRFAIRVDVIQPIVAQAAA